MHEAQLQLRRYNRLLLSGVFLVILGLMAYGWHCGVLVPRVNAFGFVPLKK